MKNDYRQIYYENRELWDPVAWQGQEADIQRARTAIEWLPGEVVSVLDVGCGNGVYTNITESNRFKAGMDRSRAALENLSSPALQADASLIPFDNGTFDACLSMELLEHLPEIYYAKVREELMRVARHYILISVPYKEQLNHKMVICPSCKLRFHPYYHLREFRLEDIRSLFAPQFSLDRCSAIVPKKKEAIPGLWNSIRMYRHRNGKNFPRNAVCPNCGYSPPAEQVLPKHNSSARGWRMNLHNWWPKHTTYTWWLALYGKNVR